ncbi:PREDICTED: uncharacterized protein LOC109149905 [Ipomoea nil]|uniref:uncharacterized protein LOC109149905 n=1 Tax=Ipomoea nil TaxID=35883 RepID=UPI0009018849|nr:PREDICTED: uncharacterized protein LOC109149905 [Ipomoea nil]
MTRDGNRVGRIRGRGRGASVTLPSSSPSSSALPSLVAPIVAPPPAIVSPTIVSPASIGSPPELPIPSPSDSTAPPTSSSVAGSSTACDLPIVHIEDGRLMPSNTCSHTITKILKQRIYPDGYTWKTVSNEYKEYYFEEFKKYFKWDETINSQVHKVFLTQTSTRYTDMVSKIKKNRTSSGKPEFVHEDTWRIWEAYWDRPEVKAKSEQQRKNRMSEVAGPGTGCSRHTGGSRSSIEHFHTLRNELQKEPNLFECFTHTHKKKDGTFVDERSKKIADEIQARRDAIMQEAEGSTDPPVIDMSQMYVDVVGGVKKQRIYGLGTKSSAFISGNSCSSSATSQLQQEAMKEMMN